jgi:hypothetical protein
MKCKFYGTCCAGLMGSAAAPEFPVLLTQGGNQCGLIVEKYSPCRMEIAGQEVDFDQCELKGTARAEQFKNFERRQFVERGQSK